jgi:hypothetical protein
MVKDPADIKENVQPLPDDFSGFLRPARCLRDELVGVRSSGPLEHLMKHAGAREGCGVSQSACSLPVEGGGCQIVPAIARFPSWPAMYCLRRSLKVQRSAQGRRVSLRMLAC